MAVVNHSAGLAWPRLAWRMAVLTQALPFAQEDGSAQGAVVALVPVSAAAAAAQEEGLTPAPGASSGPGAQCR